MDSFMFFLYYCSELYRESVKIHHNCITFSDLNVNY